MKSAAVCLALFAFCLVSTWASPIQDQLKEEAKQRKHLEEVEKFIENLRQKLDANTDKMSLLAAGSEFQDANLDRLVDSVIVSMAISRSMSLRFIQNDLEFEEGMSQSKALARKAWKQVADDLAENKQAAAQLDIKSASDRTTLDRFFDQLSELMSEESEQIVGEPLAALKS